MPFAVDEVRLMVGRGSPVLIERAAASRNIVLDAATHAAMLTHFLEHYAAAELRHEDTSLPYEGAAEILQRLHDTGVATAVVTNKQRDLAVALLERLGLAQWIDVIIGGDSCERRKPDPQPLQHACYILHCDVGDTLMVGDSINDVQAARGAGMSIICVSYGYNEGRDPKVLDCDMLIDSLTELPALLIQHN
jgi:phosphoglycolate phosphatase